MSLSCCIKSLGVSSEEKVSKEVFQCISLELVHTSVRSTALSQKQRLSIEGEGYGNSHFVLCAKQCNLFISCIFSLHFKEVPMAGTGVHKCVMPM